MSTTTDPDLTSPVPALRHGAYEDAQALFTGSLFVGITMMMFAQAGLLTGSTAGLAFVLHYATGWSFGAIYFAINIPFYWFAWTPGISVAQNPYIEFTFVARRSGTLHFQWKDDAGSSLKVDRPLAVA